MTLTTAAEHRSDPASDTSETLDGERLGQLGSAAQQLLLSLDQGIEPGPSTTGYLYLGDRILRGWAIQLVLAAMTLPFLAAAVDLFARTRRRRIPLAPALRALRTRLLFWLSVGAVFVLYAAVRRWATPAAGLLAGAALALTPVATLMFRFDNPDALLVLLLTVSAYGVVRAVDGGSLRWMAVAGGAALIALATAWGAGLLPAGPRNIDSSRSQPNVQTVSLPPEELLSEYMQAPYVMGEMPSTLLNFAFPSNWGDSGSLRE